ncbi:MAG: polysaccharide deacetylase family protein [Bacteroidia bacterium]|nr:polysaccharide deacetylase family protein [Bacteroidia bacterium]
MKPCLIFCTLLYFSSFYSFAQDKEFRNDKFIRHLYHDSSYVNHKTKLIKLFAHSKPGQWGEFVKGVDEELATQRKIIALTFDACGGKHGSKYDRELIEFLRAEKIAATLFVAGIWIDKNTETFRMLSRDTLFEIENHGFNHKPCAVDGESEYGIRGTHNVPDAYDEIEANELKIQKLTGRRPLFYRSATAYTDEACAKIARQLGVTVVSFDLLSGDAIPHNPVDTIVHNVLKNMKPGAIVIMHFNRPEWNTYEALKKIVPQLRKLGYSFTRLQDYPLKEDKASE